MHEDMLEKTRGAGDIPKLQGMAANFSHAFIPVVLLKFVILFMKIIQQMLYFCLYSLLHLITPLTDWRLMLNL